MRASIAAIALIAAALAAGQAAAAESAYTKLNFSDGSCKPMGPPATQEDEDLGVASLLCPGYMNYPVQYNSGDERETVHYGDPAKATTDTVWESFTPFNSIGDTVEWRLKDGVPFAAIQRYRLSAGDEDPAKGQVLVVSRVGQPGGPSGCVVALVDALANKDANEMARKVADDVTPSFTCGKDQAVYHGERGPRAGDFQADFSQ